MSGFASSLMMSTAFTPMTQEGIPEEESAGKAGRWLGIAAAIFIPYAAPALFGAIAGSGVLGAGLATAAQTGTLSTLASTLGSSVVGGLMNAGVAYASGARGGEVWQAAGAGAIQGGTAGLARASTALQARNAAFANTQAALGGGTAGLAVTAPTAGVAAGTGGGVMAALQQRVGGALGGMDLNRMGAAIINAAVNGTQMAGMDDLVEQQRRELAALAATNQQAYQARIGEAQKILASADAMDPAWRGRIAMADVQGAESRAGDQVMRNIAVRQGGSLDAGQRKAYERGNALHTARSKSLAYNQGFKQAEVAQTQMRAQGAGLLGPDQMGFQIQQAGRGLEVDAQRARDELWSDTAGAFNSALFGTQYNPATSPDPSSNYDEEDSNGSTFGRFGS